MPFFKRICAKYFNGCCNCMSLLIKKYLGDCKNFIKLNNHYVLHYCSCELLKMYNLQNKANT